MAREVIECETLAEVIDDLDQRGIGGAARRRAINGYISLKAKYSDIPVNGVFELTPFCNLDCKMCYVHLTPDQLKTDEKLLPVEIWKDIIRQAVKAGMMYATLTGGECLTYPDFREVYKYLVSMGIQPDILTNGRLLTEDTVGFLAKYPPGVIQVSIYGSNEDAYEQVTGHRSFEEVMQGITRARNAGLNLTLTITPNRYMQKDVRALLDFVYAQNVPYVIGDSTLIARPETGRKIDDYAVELKEYAAIKRADREFSLSVPATASERMIPDYVPTNVCQLHGLPCGGAHNTFHVNWKGELSPCTGFSLYVHSDIRKSGFAEAWKEICMKMASYRPPEECQSCTMRNICTTCPAERNCGEISGKLNTIVCERMQLLTGEKVISAAGSCPSELI